MCEVLVVDRCRHHVPGGRSAAIEIDGTTMAGTGVANRHRNLAESAWTEPVLVRRFVDLRGYRHKAGQRVGRFGDEARIFRGIDVGALAHLEIGHHGGLEPRRVLFGDAETHEHRFTLQERCEHGPWAQVLTRLHGAGLDHSENGART